MYSMKKDTKVSCKPQEEQVFTDCMHEPLHVPKHEDMDEQSVKSLDKNTLNTNQFIYILVVHLTVVFAVII